MIKKNLKTMIITSVVILLPIVVGLILGQAIGRWGNFFNQEAFGEVIDVLRRRGCRYLVVENKADPHFQLLIGRFIFEPMPGHEGFMRMQVTVPGVEGPVYG